ncbi:hypothetical protein [Chishuiella sp.]|uniref:hypothetical protein n=1 Tax=Chishuiella sp. TaxID=1969467 RepID=UPI0028A897A7|nr:hypothetical protein [Chishuiella sp.]
MTSYWKCFLLILLVNYSCITKNKDQNILYFSGRIANAETDSIYLLLNNREKAFALDFDGNFSDTVRLVDEGYKILSIDRDEYTVYLVPEDSLVLNVDLNKIDTNFSFTGKGNKRNNYLIKKDFETDNFLADNTELFQLNPQDFRTKITVFHKKIIQELEKSDVNPIFIGKERKNLNYDYINLLYSYKDSYSYFHPESTQLPINFLTELDKIDLDNDEDFRTFQSYRSLVLTNLQEKLYEGFSAEALLDNIKSSSIKNGFLNSLIYELDAKDPNSKAIYEAILKHCTYQPWLDEAKKRMQLK